jgi:Aldo/keto reductases, related to diketogulonate reductase
MQIIPKNEIALSDGFHLPLLGLGTWKLSDAEASRVVAEAINEGYRLIDTGQRYQNEYGVGLGLKWANVRRDEVVVTSKVRGGDQGYEQTLRAFQASRRNLGVDVVDLFFIHWPLPKRNLYVDTFRALQKLRDDGFIRSIGVCNFEIEHLQRLLDETGELPAVNQIEMHVGFRQSALVEGCKNLGIAVQGWGAIGRGLGLLNNPTLIEVSRKYDVTPAQVALAWVRYQGAAALAKSASPSRRTSNLESLNLKLEKSDLMLLEEIPESRIGKDPRTDEEF